MGVAIRGLTGSLRRSAIPWQSWGGGRMSYMRVGVAKLHVSPRLLHHEDAQVQAAPHVSLVPHQAPDFTAQAVFADNSIKPLTLSSHLQGKYGCLLFYPLDFTFVCPTEIIAFDEQRAEFAKRNVEVIGVSVDSQFCHLAWKQLPREQGGIGNIQFPLVADITKQIARKYGVLHDESFSLRGLFLIDQKGIVRHALMNDPKVGRNVLEVLRIVDALQHTEQFGEVCPANWRKGTPALKPTQEGVKSYNSKLS